MDLNNIVGKKVTQVRSATPREMQKCGWEGEQPPVVVVLENGYAFLPSRDAKMNEPGQMLVVDVMTGEVCAFQGGGQSCSASPQPTN